MEDCLKAIISVYDKTGVGDLAKRLVELGFEIYSTGGTKKVLAEAGLPVKSISELTGFPEILEGRVKTLHPSVHGGILARRDLPEQMAQLEEHQIAPIDLVVVNLYPFVQAVSRPDVLLSDALENIDIGGPTMIRASAKNFPSVVVLVDPADYDEALDGFAKGEVPQDVRRKLAAKAFQHTATYDTHISRFLRGPDEQFPANQTMALRKVQDLRYGENPHQRAALYREELVGLPGRSIVDARQLHGKELSFNNILDADAALAVVADFADPTVAIVKHTNPCGLATNGDLVEAFRMAYAGDPASAYGGIVAVNRPIAPALADAISKTFFEVIIAPSYSPEAIEVLGKRANLRLLEINFQPGGLNPQNVFLDWKRVSGGFLSQTADDIKDDLSIGFRVATRRAPTDHEVKDLMFAWIAVKHVKSNAITLCRDNALVGMGAGQPSRVDSVLIALQKAGDRAAGASLASDAFFPFADSVERAAAGGVRAIIQPGGSVRDEESIAAADAHDIAMVFTGRRHFKH
jgi:phosphoribosylaminoimidazolecarboxamide formyltransferase / IMP cyclohydrolase